MAERILDKDEDWEKRILCVDESCIGTISHDGRCRECGKPYDGTINSAAAVAEINQEQAKQLENLKNNANNLLKCEKLVSSNNKIERFIIIDKPENGSFYSQNVFINCGKYYGIINFTATKTTYAKNIEKLNEFVNKLTFY